MVPEPPPPNSPKNLNFEKLKKLSGDIIVFHICTINDNHMMYFSWHIQRDRQNVLSFWTIFCPFTSPNNPIKRKWKKCLEISSFYNSVPKIMIIRYTFPEIWHVTDVITFSFWAIFCLFTSLTAQKMKIKKKKKEKNTWRYHHFTHVYQKSWSYCYTVPEIWCVTDLIVIFHFGLFFAVLPPNSPQNRNFQKMKKTPKDIIILHTCTKNYDQMMYSSWDMVRNKWTDRRMDGWTDRWKKWHIEVGVPPKKPVTDLPFCGPATNMTAFIFTRS